MKIEIKSRKSQVVFFLIAAGFATWVGFGFVDFIQLQRTRNVFSAIEQANDQRKKKGESLEAADAYLAALRAIDVDYTKKELRPAYTSYVSGFAEGIQLAKEGKSTEPADAKIKAAHQALVEIAKRYE
ncbi:MAG: hypothetical protein HZA31_06095 [Opitutae bacterium]|nr:hypothetical protein [Opitutae bacterium]